MKKIISAQQVVFIDFDRTLFDSDAFMEHFYEVAIGFGISLDSIKQAHRTTQNDGGTFEPLTLLKQLLKPQEVQMFLKQLIKTDTSSLLYSDAVLFLRKLDENMTPYHIITYGVSSEWQEIKIKASGFKGSYTIMDTPDKGAFIANTKLSDGKYTISIGTDKTFEAETACLIDDKAIAFDVLPKDCTGYMIQRTSELLPSQKGALPENVKLIKSLNELSIKDNTLQLLLAR